MAKENNKMLIFLIPVYNEEKNIKTLLENTRDFAQAGNYSYRVVIVNDGSADGTMRILESYQKTMPITILNQKVNLGVGKAFKRGFEYAAEIADGNDIIISKEADNTSDLSVLSEMINKINDGYDLVLASCYMDGGGVEGTNLYRKILSSGANFLLKIATPLKNIHTFSSFYRAHKADLIKKASRIYGNRLIEEKGFACMVELLLKFAKMNARIAEVPMTLRGNLRIGKSKMKTTKTIAAYLRLITRNMTGRL